MSTGEGIVQRMSQGMPHSPGDERRKIRGWFGEYIRSVEWWLVWFIPEVCAIPGQGLGDLFTTVHQIGGGFCMVLLRPGEVARGWVTCPGIGFRWQFRMV